MTWLRWDTDSPRSATVGHLAGELGIPPAHAFGLYAACCLGFGDHQRNGEVDAIPDATLELWAGWTGKRGRFAKAFRQHCRADGSGSDETGKIRGWWRNSKLLERQEADARRPNQKARKAAKSPADPQPIPLKSPAGLEGDLCGESGGNGTVRYEQQPPPSEARVSISRLVNRIQGEPARQAIYGFFETLPADQTPDAWAKAFSGYLDGLGTAEGKAARPEQLAATCLAYPNVVRSAKWGLIHFVSCLDRQIAADARPPREPPLPKARVADVVARFAAGEAT